MTGMLAGLKKVQSTDDKTEKPSEDAKALEEKTLFRSDKHHYIWMEQSFDDSRKWVWIVNIIVYIAVITIYFCVDGHELIYTLYLPLDFLLNLSKAIYYWSLYYLDLKNKERQEKLRNELKSDIELKIKNAFA